MIFLQIDSWEFWKAVQRTDGHSNAYQGPILTKLSWTVDVQWQYISD